MKLELTVSPLSDRTYKLSRVPGTWICENVCAKQMTHLKCLAVRARAFSLENKTFIVTNLDECCLHNVFRKTAPVRV